jgi:hypothetical protein
VACLGGTRDEPRIWWRYNANGDFVRVEGRICQNDAKRYANPRTSRTKCAMCPAFRGVRANGTAANGCAPNGDPIGLSSAEHGRYQLALEAALDDDMEPLFAFERSREREAIQRTDGTWHVVPGWGEATLLRMGDPDATERRAAYLREWRKTHPDTRKRDRAAYMRSYRARQKQEA